MISTDLPFSPQASDNTVDGNQKFGQTHQLRFGSLSHFFGPSLYIPRGFPRREILDFITWHPGPRYWPEYPEALDLSVDLGEMNAGFLGGFYGCFQN